MTRSGASLVRMFVFMILMAALMLVGFSVYANWDKDANGDGKPDGFTLRLFDLSWYGMAKDTARPMAKDAKKRILEIKDDLLAEDGLLEKGQQWYLNLVSENNGEKITVRSPDNPKNKRDILNKKTDTPDDVEPSPVKEYKFDATNPAEKPTLHLEDDIYQAGEHFAIGLAAYRSAFDENREPNPGFEEYIYNAETNLRTTQKMLTETLPEYAKRGDKDTDLLKRSRDVLESCSELIKISFAESENDNPY